MDKPGTALNRQSRVVRTAVLVGIGIGIVMLSFAVMRPAEALSGTIAGRAATAEGSILDVSVSVNAITLPSDGNQVSAGAALNATADVDILGSTLSVGAISETASTSCEGVPGNDVVSAECTSLVEGLDVGVTLDPAGGGPTVASIISADALQAVSTSTDDGSGPTSSSAGTIITGLCVYLDGSTCTSVTGSGTFNITIAQFLTGTIEIVAEEPRTEHGGVDGSGLTVTMLRINLEAVQLLGGIEVMNLDLVVADSFVGGVVDDATATPTSTPVNGATPTSTPVNGATPTSTPVNGATPTSTPVNGATPTSTPVNGATPTSTPVNGATPTSTPVDGATPTSTPVDGATPTSTPVDGATPTSTPVDGATATPTNTPHGGPSAPTPPATGNNGTGGGSGSNALLLLWVSIAAMIASAGALLLVRKR